MRARRMLAAAALMVVMSGAARAAGSDDVAAGRALARQRCGECHVVVPGSGAGWTNAPAFDEIANRKQTSAAWLTRFIPQQHAHMINYEFSQAQLRALSAYIMSLRQR
jgi:cytochrome c